MGGGRKHKGKRAGRGGGHPAAHRPHQSAASTPERKEEAEESPEIPSKEIATPPDADHEDNVQVQVVHSGPEALSKSYDQLAAASPSVEVVVATATVAVAAAAAEVKIENPQPVQGAECQDEVQPVQPVPKDEHVAVPTDAATMATSNGAGTNKRKKKNRGNNKTQSGAVETPGESSDCSQGAKLEGKEDEAKDLAIKVDGKECTLPVENAKEEKVGVTTEKERVEDKKTENEGARNDRVQ